jgi:predicted house-cleaning noncanonical NTP pyrophosphatase (MazG superfamily)
VKWFGQRAKRTSVTIFCASFERKLEEEDITFIKKNPTKCNNVMDIVRHILFLTMSNNYTSNNLLRMKNQRLPVQF